MESSQHIICKAEHYPLKVLSWKVKAGESVKKDESLGVYEFQETITITLENGQINTETKRRRAEIRSLYHGDIENIFVKAGGRCLNQTQSLGSIKEPCSHAVQLSGLCALCGKDLTISDYIGSDMTRATISITHDALGVTISQNEASRLEKERANVLLKGRKLSLLLDLDQTVIHATVDPVVGSWLNDPHNLNFPTLKDVYFFILPESPTVYYIKLRPGTFEFLNRIKDIYELHIYTMGTRNYAQEISKILDPTHELFKDRILSRDESGSFTVKSIQRLFPCDQSMVVVVDDR